MSLTAEIYAQFLSKAGQNKDVIMLEKPGNAVSDSVFLPWKLESSIIKRFPDAFTANQGLERSYEGDEAVLSGICALPMVCNQLLEPSNGVGSAGIMTASGVEKLSVNFQEAVKQFIENPPPITLPNLLKAGGLSSSKTVLIAEVFFYTQFTLDKIKRNSDKQPNDSELQAAESELQVFFQERYKENLKAFKRLRELVLNKPTESMGEVVQVDDNNPEFAGCYQEQIDSYIQNRGLSGLSRNALAVAAYYSSAIVKAYVDAKIMDSSERGVIYEGMSNLVMPEKRVTFNNVRKRAFNAQLEVEGFWGDRTDRDPDNKVPGLVAAAPVVRGLKRLQSESLESVNPYRVPNSINALAYDWGLLFNGRADIADLGQNLGFNISLVLPGTPQIRSLQRAYIELTRMPKAQSTSDRSLRNKMFGDLTELVLSEAGRILKYVLTDKGEC